MIIKFRLGVITLFLSVVYLVSCIKGVEPSPEQPVDAVVVNMANVAAKHLINSAWCFMPFEAINVDTVRYYPVFTNDPLIKIEFNSTKSCWLDSIGNPYPWQTCTLYWPAYGGIFEIRWIKAKMEIEGEFIELYFSPDSLNRVDNSAPPLLKRTDNIHDAYFRYVGAYSNTQPVRYELDRFLCYRFSSTIYPQFTHSDSLGFVEVSDSSAPLANGGNGYTLQGQQWDYWRADSARTKVGVPAPFTVSLPVRFMRWGKYESKILGYRAVKLIDSLVYTDAKIALIRSSDSIKVTVGSDTSRIALLRRPTSDSIVCEWAEGGGSHSYSGGNALFRNSQTTALPNRDQTECIVKEDSLFIVSKVGAALDTTIYSVKNDSLSWIDSSLPDNLSGCNFLLFGQVYSRFSNAYGTGWAYINLWTGNGACETKVNGGLVYRCQISNWKLLE